MVNYIEKYEKIIDELIRKSFPEFKNEKIIVEERNTKKWRAHAVYSISGLKILVSNQLREFPEWKVKRILIHELCHLVEFKKLGYLRTKIDFVIYLLSKKHRTKIEREANILMIRKGYGKLVLSAHKENLTRGLGYSLTEKEIKSYITKFKK
jgi:predicted SprT family Zn-dependent metalloprotease